MSVDKETIDRLIEAQNNTLLNRRFKYDGLDEIPPEFMPVCLALLARIKKKSLGVTFSIDTTNSTWEYFTIDVPARFYIPVDYNVPSEEMDRLTGLVETAESAAVAFFNGKRVDIHFCNMILNDDKTRCLLSINYTLKD